jgi:hypothetical protein
MEEVVEGLFKAKAMNRESVCNSVCILSTRMRGTESFQARYFESERTRARIALTRSRDGNPLIGGREADRQCLTRG